MGILVYPRQANAQAPPGDPGAQRGTCQNNQREMQESGGRA
jgi:hypothetical protein